MATKDPGKRRAAMLKYRAKRHAERFGPGAGDMRGRHGNHARGVANGKWNAGRLITSHGYVIVRVDESHPRAFGPAHGKQKYAYEHDMVMEEALCRHLRDDEVVHHVNGNRQDNAPTNLRLETRGDHARGHCDAPGARDEKGRFRAGVARSRAGADPAEWPEDLRVREFPR